MSILKFLSFLALEVVFKSLRCGKGFQLLFQFYRFFVNLKYLSFLLSLPPLPLSLSLSHIQLLALESNKICGICLKVTCWHGKSINNFFLVNPNFFSWKKFVSAFLYLFDKVKLNVKLKVCGIGIELFVWTFHDCLAKLILYNRINYHGLNIHMHQKLFTSYRWVDAQCNIFNDIVSSIGVYLGVHVQGKFIIGYY